MQQAEEDTTSRVGFFGKLTNVKILQHIFKTISQLNDDACIYIKKDGLKMTVETAKAFQANAFIQANIFNEFNIGDDDEFGFNVSLSTMLECLSIFGSSSTTSTGSSLLTPSSSITNSAQSCLTLGGQAFTSLVLHYGKYGDPVSMWMEEDGVVCKADIPTQDIKETLYFDFLLSHLESVIK